MTEQDEAIQAVADAVDTLISAIRDIYNKIVEAFQIFKIIIIEIWEGYIASIFLFPMEIKADDILSQSDLLWWEYWQWPTTNLL